MTNLELILRNQALLELAAVIGEIALVLVAGAVVWGCVAWRTAVWKDE